MCYYYKMGGGKILFLYIVKHIETRNIFLIACKDVILQQKS